jgi:hypothetical protein
MDDLTPLERAVMLVIVAQATDIGPSLGLQLDSVRVAKRENTGAGFYTTFEVSAPATMDGVKSPLGDVGATVQGLEHGMGFLLWLEDGRINQLEGYSYEESTTGLDLQRIRFSAVGPRRARSA